MKREKNQAKHAQFMHFVQLHRNSSKICIMYYSILESIAYCVPGMDALNGTVTFLMKM